MNVETRISADLSKLAEVMRLSDQLPVSFELKTMYNDIGKILEILHALLLHHKYAEEEEEQLKTRRKIHEIRLMVEKVTR